LTPEQDASEEAELEDNASPADAADEEEEEVIMAPPPPKTNRHQPDKGFKFGGLALDSSESHQSEHEKSD
jgi:hypothetical protein